ncbi:hypothetical protein KJ780_00670, partial [Candidatus Micrarchaeota archaeon]|nr:hypothetical protein [Candidatus Micrarchaeota archaeon]
IRLIMSQNEGQGRKFANMVMDNYMAAAGLQEKDREIAVFFKPAIIEENQGDLDILRVSLENAYSYFGINSEQIQLIIKGDHEKFRGSLLAKGSEFRNGNFYKSMNEKGFSDNEIIGIAMNFVGSAADVYRLKGADATPLLENLTIDVPERKTLVRNLIEEYVLKKPKTEEIVDATLNFMWRTTNANLNVEKEEYRFDLGMIQGALRGNPKTGQASEMFGFEKNWVDKPALAAENVRKNPKMKEWLDLIGDKLTPAQAVDFLASMVLPTADLMTLGKSPAEIKKALQIYLTENEIVSVNGAMDVLRDMGQIEKILYTVPYIEGEGWNVRVEHLGHDLLIGSGAADALTKHVEHEMMARKRSWGEDTAEFIAKTWGKGSKKYETLVGESMVKLRKELDFEKIQQLVRDYDSAYQSFFDSATTLVNKHFREFDDAARKKMISEFFFGYVAVLEREQGYKLTQMNSVIKNGGTEKFSVGEIRSIVLDTIPYEDRGNRSRAEYQVWHVGHNGAKNMIGSYVQHGRKETINTKEVNWNVGDWYYIIRKSAGGDVLEGYIPALYFNGKQRRDEPGYSFSYNEKSEKKLTAEMTLLNLVARSNPFDIVGRGMERLPTWEAINSKPVSIPNTHYSVDPGARRSLQYVSFASPITGMFMPVMSQDIQITRVFNYNPSASFSYGSSGITGRYLYFNQTNQVLEGLGYSPALTNDKIRDNLINYFGNGFMQIDAVRDAVRIGNGTFYIYVPTGETATTVSTNPPAGGEFSLRVVINGNNLTANAVNPGETPVDVIEGTVSYDENRNVTSVKTETITGPVFLTLANLANGRLPYGFEWSAGAKGAFQFTYSLESKLPREYQNKVDVYPYVTLSRPFSLGAGIIANPYAMGMWDIKGGKVYPSFGASMARSFRGDIFGASFSAGFGFDSGKTEIFPHAGAGVSAYGVYMGAGVNPAKIGQGLLYGELGYDYNRDGVMDYGVRMINAGPVWVPDIIFDGRGVITWTLRGAGSIYQKTILGKEAM